MLGFTDSYGETGNVGDVVGYNENFLNFGITAEMLEKLYVVMECPNYGDMVVMREITDFSYDNETKTYTCVHVVPSASITVEPYKVVLI